MRIELTVRHEGRDQDVAITSAMPVALDVLRPELARVAGLPVDRPVWSGDVPLPDSTLLGDDGLRCGAVLGVGGPARSAPQTGALALHQVGGPDAGRVRSLSRGRLVLGRDPGCDLVLADDDVSRRHAVLEIGDGVLVRDLGSTNGTWIDEQPVGAEGTVLLPGRLLRLGDCTFALVGPSHVPAAVTAADDGTVRLLRPPRQPTPAAPSIITLPRPPDHQRPRAVQWVAALVPAVAGGALAWFAHSPQFVLFVLLSPLMMVSTSLGDRLHWRRSRRRGTATYARRSAEAARQIAEALHTETDGRRSAAPDPAELIRLADLPGSRLWERRRTDTDFLALRLGTADRPSRVQVRDGNDERPAGTVPSVPHGVDLRDGPLGVAVPAEVRAGLARWLVAQLAALHSPADLGLCLLLADAVAADWAWARWLPHLQGHVHVGRDEGAAAVADLTALVDGRLADRRATTGGWSGPWLVLVVDGAAALSDVPGLAALLARCTAAGVSAICLDDDPAAIPTGCAGVVVAHGETGTRALVHDAHGGSGVDLVLDTVTARWSATLARDLAPLVDPGADGSAALPASCGLLDTLGVPAPDTGIDPAAIVDRWERSADGGARTIIGRGPDGPLRLDLVADGPHALVAGTTGAGKSELLQTLVAGLAADQSPADLSVLLIDYKGGAAFADCARLPHTAGLVTDLDAHLTARALRSLHSELRRRERVLGEAGAADLTAYRAMHAPRGPLPRLVIVVDEFATLAEELPDFVTGLIGVAQRGRSLGLHLVLATQRPSSAVSPEIRANTSVRIALRVTDAADSSDVIDSPDAATIERGTPGRGYVRTGSSLLCFQAAYGGGPVRSTTGVRVEALGPWRRCGAAPEESGYRELGQLVDAIDKAAAAVGAEPARSPWLAPLPDALPAAVLPPPAGGVIAIGLVDRPDDQRRDALTFDVGRGASLLVAGTARSGRTGALAVTAMQAAAAYGADALSLQIVDAAGGLATQLAALPHCASVLGPDDLAAVPTLLRRLAEPVTDRPRCLLLVDGWDILAASLGDIEAVECADLLAAVRRVPDTSVVVSGDRTVLAPRFASGFEARIVLRMADRNDFGMLGVAVRDVPAELPPGRGLCSDGAVVQLAIAADHPDPAATARAAQALADRTRPADAHPHPGAVRLRALPATVRLADLAGTVPVGFDRGLVLGVGGDDAHPLHVDLFRGTARLLVAGPPRSGRSTLLLSLFAQARATGTRVLVAAPARSPLRTAAHANGTDVLEAHAGAGSLAPPPDRPTLLLVDDVEAFADCALGEALTEWLRRPDLPLAAVVAGRADDLATSYRGIAAQVRRANTGVLLRPGPVDGEILGVRLARRRPSGPPGRGVLIGDPAWGADYAVADPLPLQVALP